jgi:hypothetical protein
MERLEVHHEIRDGLLSLLLPPSFFFFSFLGFCFLAKLMNLLLQHHLLYIDSLCSPYKGLEQSRFCTIKSNKPVTATCSIVDLCHPAAAAAAEVSCNSTGLKSSYLCEKF